MVGSAGKVVGIEHLQQLVDLSRRNMDRFKPGNNVQVILGDGRMGVKDELFDAIHVGAASSGVPEQVLSVTQLVECLAANGRMVVPIEFRFEEYLCCVDKDENGQVSVHRMIPVRYVPLTDARSQWSL
jgi:protein-L-isoaspartate(D-aspartate) O-methyltransferase